MTLPAPKFAAPEPGSPFRGAAQTFSPPWLLRPNGARYVYSNAVQWDALAEYTRLGMLQRFPTVAQPSALAPLGRDRKIWRGLSEADEHYAERLRTFKRTWKFAGNAPTLLRQLWELMTPNVTRIRYVVNGYEGVASEANQFADWWTINESGLTFERSGPQAGPQGPVCNWNWDGRFGKNIRFWLIIYRTDLSPADWGVPPYQWGEPDLDWGAEPGSDRSWVIDTFNIVAAFKAAGSHMGPYTQAFDGGLIVADPTFTSAPWGVDGPFPPNYAPGYPMPAGTFGVSANRPPGAIYMSGL